MKSDAFYAHTQSKSERLLHHCGSKTAGDFSAAIWATTTTTKRCERQSRIAVTGGDGHFGRLQITWSTTTAASLKRKIRRFTAVIRQRRHSLRPRPDSISVSLRWDDYRWDWRLVMRYTNEVMLRSWRSAERHLRDCLSYFGWIL